MKTTEYKKKETYLLLAGWAKYEQYIYRQWSHPDIKENWTFSGAWDIEMSKGLEEDAYKCYRKTCEN
jgi:hypothetical protein